MRAIQSKLLGRRGRLVVRSARKRNFARKGNPGFFESHKMKTDIEKIIMIMAEK